MNLQPRELGNHYKAVRFRLNKGRPVKKVRLSFQPIPQRTWRCERPLGDGKIAIVRSVHLVKGSIFFDYAIPSCERVSMDLVIATTARIFNIPVPEILAFRRHIPVVRARQIAIYLICEMTPHSLSAIGRRLGRDHTTCLYARNKIGREVKASPKFGRKIEAIKSKILEAA